jgi:hypothetical protein
MSFLIGKEKWMVHVIKASSFHDAYFGFVLKALPTIN